MPRLDDAPLPGNALLARVAMAAVLGLAALAAAACRPAGSLAAAHPSAPWRAPVEGPVVGRFRPGPDPFAAGQRRGIDLAADAGAAVRAPCAGRVAFAGSVPSRGGAVSIRCGRLTATVLGLAAPAVRAGAAVRSGDPLGSVAPGGRIRLGARVTGRRFGYVDPEVLLGRDGTPRSPAAPLAGRRPRLGPGGGEDPLGARRPARAPAGMATPAGTSAAMLRQTTARGTAPGVAPSAAPVAAPAAAPAAASAARSGSAPLAAWAGLALVAAGLPGGALCVRARAARRAPRARVSPDAPIRFGP